MLSISYDIDKQDFMRWLQERPKQVFQQWNSFNCALALYLNQITDSTGANLTYDSSMPGKSDEFHVNGASHPLPDWAVGVNRMAHGRLVGKFTGAEILAKLEAL